MPLANSTRPERCNLPPRVRIAETKPVCYSGCSRLDARSAWAGGPGPQTVSFSGGSPARRPANPAGGPGPTRGAHGVGSTAAFGARVGRLSLSEDPQNFSKPDRFSREGHAGSAGIRLIPGGPHPPRLPISATRARSRHPWFISVYSPRDVTRPCPVPKIHREFCGGAHGVKQGGLPREQPQRFNPPLPHSKNSRRQA